MRVLISGGYMEDGEGLKVPLCTSSTYTTSLVVLC